MYSLKLMCDQFSKILLNCGRCGTFRCGTFTELAGFVDSISLWDYWECCISNRLGLSRKFFRLVNVIDAILKLCKCSPEVSLTRGYYS